MNDCVQVNLRITTNSNQGGRQYMEDTYAIALQRLNPSDKESPISLAYFGIFDGHGGKEAAEFARQHLCQHILEQDDFWSDDASDKQILAAIRQGFLSCHNDMWNHVEKWNKTSSGLPSTSGCTASVIFVRGNKLYIGHVGDSSIVLGEGESLYETWKGHRITRDHKPEDPSELKRIRECGGNVLCKGGVHRVVWNRQKFFHTSSNGNRYEQTKTTIEYEQIPFLAISRALGDLWSFNRETNLYSVSPEPELTVIEIDPNKHRCLILASDGLWNMITPEVAVEIVRNCDVKTEEMILKSDDDDDRPFRNPSHELVQKALVSWRQRMLRADNITCITVMLDPPGPPFSDCILQKKKQQFNPSSNLSSSVCSETNVENESSSSPLQIPVDMNERTPQRPKLIGQSKDHILMPIDNGSTLVRTPKRPASDEPVESLDETPRRKIIKTKNGSSSTSNLHLRPVFNVNTHDEDEDPEQHQQQDDEEYLPLAEQTAKMTTKDKDSMDNLNSTNDYQMMETDSNVNQQKMKSAGTRRRRSRFRFSFSTNPSSNELPDEEPQEPAAAPAPPPSTTTTLTSRKSRLGRTLSASILNQENDQQNQMKSSRRRKSYSSTGLANELKQFSSNEPINQIDQKSTKTKSSLATRVKRAFFRPHRAAAVSSSTS